MLNFLKKLFLLCSKKRFSANVSTAVYFDEMIRISSSSMGPCTPNMNCGEYK